MPNYHTLNKKICYIYKIINTVNGKIYIGQHRTNDIDDGYMGSGKLITRAFAKYGIHNFTKEILQFVTSLNEANEVEAKAIKDSRSTDKNIGYNISPNAVGGQQKTQETKDKMSAYWKGKPKSEKHKQSMRKPKSIDAIENMKRAAQIAKEKRVGKSWYYNPLTNDGKQFSKDDVPQGWIKGRPNNHIKPQTKESNEKRSKKLKGIPKPQGFGDKISEIVTKQWEKRHEENGVDS